MVASVKTRKGNKKIARACMLEGLEARQLLSFTAGNLVVERVGTGSGALAATATPIFIDEYNTTTANQASTVSTVALPSADGSAITAKGTATTEGLLSLSVDGRYLIVPGYRANVGSTDPSTIASTTDPRAIVRISINDTIDATTLLTDAYSTATMRGVVSADGSSFWTTGSSGGIRYATIGATTSTQISNTATGNPTNLRAISIYSGSLYADASTATGPLFGPGLVSGGLATTGPQSITQLTGFPISSGPSAYQFVFKDANTIYVADDRAVAGGGIEKWTLSGGTWTMAYSALAGTTGLRGLAIDSSGKLYGVTTEASANKLVAITDTGTGFTFTTLATAATNTAFRGVAFAPGTGVVVPVPPTVTSISQPTGSVYGGYGVTINGTHFTTGTTVKFGTTSATNVILAGDGNSLTCTVPAGAAGASTITISNGTAPDATLSGAFSYVINAPTISGITPSNGSISGGNTVTISGTNFVTNTLGGTTTVLFGSNAATSVTPSADGTSLTCVVPAGAVGIATVTVSNGTTPDATTSYQYTVAPSITNLSPSAGPVVGGNTVTINGAGFAGASQVNFGGTVIPAASFVGTPTDTQIQVTAPANLAGNVNVTVTTLGGTSSAATYTYLNAPAITGLSVTTGPSMGGTSITITGSGFTGTTAVNFGATLQGTFTIVSDTQITLKSPAHAIGTVDVTITNGGGTSAISASDHFAYTATTIAIAQAAASGTTLTIDSNPVISTIISQPGTFGGLTFTTWSFLIQDSTGSMMVYSMATTLGYTPAVGDTITVSGKNSPYQQMPELGTITAASKTGTAAVPSVQIKTINDVNLPTLPMTIAGYPVTIQNLLIGGISGTFGAANLTGTIADAGHNSMTLFYSKSYSVAVANFYGKAVPTTPVDLTGFVVVYTSGSTNTAEFVPLSMSASASAYESAALSAATSSVARTATTATITFTRSATNGTLTDAATASYTLVDGTAVYGTDYSAASQTGTVTFASGSATATLTVNILQPVGRYGTRTFSVKLNSIQPGDATRQGIVTSPSTQVVTITDARTTDISAQSAYSYDGTILLNPSGPAVDSGTGWPTTTLTIEQKVTQGLAVLSYNDPNDPTFSPFSPPTHVGYINSMALEAYGISGTWTSGKLNVYAVSNNSSDPYYMHFDTSDAEGMGTQFGTRYLLGSINYDKNQAVGVYTTFQLTTLDPNGLTVLMNGLNNHSTFRIVVTPADANVVAGWAGILNTGANYYMPKLDINYMVNAPPTIGSFTASPSSVAAGSVSILTAGTVAQTGGTVSSVAFYRESNATAGLQVGSDILLGTGTVNGSNWTYNFDTTGLAAGSYTLYAVATGTASLTSLASTTTLTVNVPPTIGSFTATTPVTVGTASTLTASNVAQTNGSISSVVFYRESNGTGGLQIGSDTLIGTGTQSGSNWTYSFDTTGLMAGTYTLYAVATGSAGGLTTTSTTTLTVNAQTPTIGAFTATTPVVSGANSRLTASNIAQIGGTVSSVVFYLESNATAGLQIGSDTLIGTGLPSGSDRVWDLSTTGMTAGTYTLYAVANGTGGLSTTVSTTLVVNAQVPAIGNFTATTPVIAGQGSTLTASNVAQTGGTVASVVFYRESNGTGGLQIGADTLIGTGTQSGSNWTYNFSTTGLAAGTYTLYAVANGTGGLSSVVASTTLQVTPATPAWVGAGSVATWDAGTNTLTVTGATTIVSDPGSLAIISASGPAAVISVAPQTANRIVHLGGLQLTSGASLSVASLGALRTHDNHLVLVIGTLNGPAPLFSVDAASKLDLQDNDLIVHSGSYASVAGLAATGRGVPAGGLLDGTWTGNGLTSSKAAARDASDGYETVGLAVARNGDLPLGAFPAWTVNSGSEQLGDNDIIVKYTYTGDFTLEGQVGDNAATIFQVFYDGGATTGNTLAYGDTNGDGLIDDTDATAFQVIFGNGTGGGSGAQL